MKKQLFDLGRVSASLGILWALGGCNQMAAEDATGQTSEAEGAASTDENGLTSINGLSSLNGLSSINGLSSLNGLSSINGLSSLNGLMTFFDGRLNVKYLVKCALPAGHQLKKQDQHGTWYTYPGAMGMGPGWENGACDKSCQEAISSCMMAHVNTAGVHVPLWMVGPNANVGWGTSSSYPNREGTFFGNIFPSNPQAYYCNGPNYATSAAPGRLGAYQSNRPYKNPFGTDAQCGSGCVKGGPAGEGYTSCNGFSNPITVWRQPLPSFDPNRDYKICAKHSGKCLDADVNQNYDGGRVVTWDFGGAANQRWKIEKLASESYFKICNRGNGRCLDLYLGGQDNGSRICTWGKYDNDYQKWAITPVGTSGTGALAGAWDGNSVSYSLGTRVTYNGGTYECMQAHTSQSTWTPTGAVSLWKSTSAANSGTGTTMYSIVAKLGAKSIDVTDHSTANGAEIQQWYYTGGSQQIWFISAL